MDKKRENFITIAKAIGIILMVVGHACVPYLYVENFIYIFHMPLFFFCSGYFFKEISKNSNLLVFFRKRIYGLYIPYVKWSVVFLLLHNILFQVHINPICYSLDDFIYHGIRILAMTENETLLRPFWFLKTLLLVSVLTSFFCFVLGRLYKNAHIEFFLLFFLIFTHLLKYMNVSMPIIGDVSVITLGSVYFLSGYVYKKRVEFFVHPNIYIYMLFFVITLIGSIYFNGTLDIRYTTVANTFFYYVLSIIGIFMVFVGSFLLNVHLPFLIKTVLYYIGNHTMPILALHLLSFKIVNYAKVLIYDLSIDKVSDHTIIHEYNSFFWIIYVLLGVFLPIVLYYSYKKSISFFSTNSL